MGEYNFAKMYEETKTDKKNARKNIYHFSSFPNNSTTTILWKEFSKIWWSNYYFLKKIIFGK